MLSAEGGELFVGHRLGLESGGQERVIDHERHEFRVARGLTG